VPHDRFVRRPEPGPRSAAGPAQARGQAAAPARRVVAPEHDEASADDPDAEDSGMVGRPVVEQLLGGRVIDEIDDER
jgi:DNA polymerase III subunit gamma/tau